MKTSTICGIVKNVLEITSDGIVEANVVYDKGEMDVLYTDRLGERTYYEIKSSNNNIKKGISQVKRAIKYGQCEYGFVITPNSWYKVN